MKKLLIRQDRSVLVVLLAFALLLSVFPEGAGELSLEATFESEGYLVSAVLRGALGVAQEEGTAPASAERRLELRRLGPGAAELLIRDESGSLLSRAEVALGDPRLAGGIRHARFFDEAGETEAELSLDADAGGRLSAFALRRPRSPATAGAADLDRGAAPVAAAASSGSDGGRSEAGDGEAGGGAAAEDPARLMLALFPSLDPLGPEAAAAAKWASGLVPEGSSFPEEGSVDYLYDAVGRPVLALIRDPSGGLVERRILRYDERGLLVEERREPGPAAQAASAKAEAPAAAASPSPPASSAEPAKAPVPLRLVHVYEIGPDGTWRARLSYEIRSERGGESRVLAQRLERRLLR